MRRATATDPAEVRKDQLWPQPDFRGLVRSGTDHIAAAIIKLLRDRVPARPETRVRQLGTRHADEVWREPELVAADYREMVGITRGVLESCRTLADIRGAKATIREVAQSRRDSDADREHLLRSIWRGHTDNLTVDYRDVVAAEDMVRKGWPAPPPPAWKDGHHVRDEGGSYALVRDTALVRDGFTSEAEAWNWLRAGTSDRLPLPGRPVLKSLMRQGPDYDVPATSDAFLRTFGLQGIEFGRTVTTTERALMLNMLGHALMDMSSALGVEPAWLGFGHALRVAVGCRMTTGRGSADYDAVTRTVMLPRHVRAGELAKCWGRAFDHWSGSVGHRGRLPVLASSARDPQATAALQLSPGERAQWLRTLDALWTAPTGATTDYANQAAALNGDGDFWTRPVEMFSRAFEAAVCDRLAEHGQRNDMVVSGAEPGRFATGYRGNPFPEGEERRLMNAAVLELVGVMRPRLERDYAEPSTPTSAKMAIAWMA